MSHSPNDMITWGKMLRKVPAIVRALPRVVRGMRAANVSDPHQPCGLGWQFEQATLLNPEGAALLYAERVLSYSEVNQCANRIAHHLKGRGIHKGDVVAIFIENRPELLLSVLAVAKLGGVCAMLNTAQTQAALVHSLKLVSPVAIVVGEELVAAYEAVRSQVAIEAQRTWFVAEQQGNMLPQGYIDLVAASAESPVDNPASAAQIFFNDPCFYIYTSGTTGLPKAGIMKHGRWTKTAVSFGNIALDMGPDDVLYCTLPLYHATGLCVCWGSAIVGASGFAIRRKFSASQFWDDARRFKATTLGYVGELCRYLLDQPARANDRDNRVTKMVGNGLRPGAWAPFKQRYGVDHICELYAASDGNIGFTNVLTFDNTIGFCLQHWALVNFAPDSGEPLRGSEGFMRKVRTGGQGLLLARIDEKSPFDGYTDPEKNRKVILCDVFAKGDRYFNTGDLVRSMGFGHAQFVDRLGDTYRWKGENVSTTEVENVLLQHPQIAEVVAYGVEIDNTNGRAGMVAITPSESLAALDMHELLQFAHRQLPHYAVPLFLRIKVKMETTGTFKYQKVRLKEEAFDPDKTGNDPVYAWLPGSDCYVPVTGPLLAQIQGGQLRY
ncbi:MULTISPECIES: long-chain-acyl-CoA synthetase [Pseudomonas]|uniref:Long-chain-acyl-CoA synthetase n=1 Tax=Pseudomonas azadiae TaxID=2843612 RepID=A0ABS6NU80_9PSED|nr:MULTISPECIES: long-chain-acyl-CoA synthetase [Pseudomonas]MBV4451768.1 long-chain-acyl-CoA synthetase [Pseudomonas azadiae]NMF39566.1 long-chain-acyl-CoA synthetase [Pseudomonas sp. SWRI 103]